MEIAVESSPMFYLHGLAEHLAFAVECHFCLLSVICLICYQNLQIKTQKNIHEVVCNSFCNSYFMKTVAVASVYSLICSDHFPDPTLNLLDERLVRVLAYQRLQQLGGKKVSLLFLFEQPSLKFYKLKMVKMLC